MFIVGICHLTSKFQVHWNYTLSEHIVQACLQRLQLHLKPFTSEIYNSLAVVYHDKNV